MKSAPTTGHNIILVGEPNILLLRVIIGCALWSFSYLLWQIYELVKYLVEHAKTRAKQIQKEEIDDDNK
jgi:hypothetical protein